jgi:gluconolactonase
VVTKAPFPALHGARILAGLGGVARFDSLAVLANGNICVATLGTGHITVIAPEGGVVRQVKMPDRFVTNICFGGADMRTAYVTLSEHGQLGALDWPVPGLKLNFT